MKFISALIDPKRLDSRTNELKVKKMQLFDPSGNFFISYANGYPFYIKLKCESEPPLSYLPNPTAQAGYDTKSIFERNLTGLNSEFSFS